MELEKFLGRLITQHKEISYDPTFWTCSNTLKKVPSNFVQIVMDSTSEIDFGCDFDESGLCFVYRNTYRNRIKDGQYILTNATGSPKCCCGGCCNSIGYLSHFTFANVHEYAKLYDEEDGFWRSGTGCVLPRPLRSPTCVKHHCLKYDEKDKPIPFPRRTEIILFMVGHLADAHVDYMEWNLVFGAHLCLGGGAATEKTFSKFIDAWVRRSPNDEWIPDRMRKSWRKYYEENSHVSQ